MLFLGPHDLVGRGLAYCLGYGGAGDTVLGGGDSVRQALARHLCCCSATPPARQPAGTGTPRRRRSPPPTAPPTPTGSFPACRPGAGLRAARCHSARREPARVSRGVGHDVGRSRAPASTQPTPPLVSWSRAGLEGQAAAGKWRRQAPPRSFPGCPRVT